jgi:hypothetical protein
LPLERQTKISYTMIKFLIIRVLKWNLKSSLPKLSPRFYNKLFNLSWKFFYFLKPSQLWVIILALLNKTEFKKLLGIPSMFILFSSIFSDSESLDSKLNSNTLIAKLIANKFDDPENNWENFFWILIVLALIRRFFYFFIFLFKVLWIPFKIAFIFYLLKYLGFDFSNLFNILNNLSLGVIDWFYHKITNFINLIFNNDNKNS